VLFISKQAIMNIPLLSVNEFINLITPKNDQTTEKAGDNIHTARYKLKKLQTKRKNKNFYDSVFDLIKLTIPEIDQEKQFHILLWTRMAFYLRTRHNIDTNSMLNKYLSWRKTQGKIFTQIANKDLTKFINIDYFILTPIRKSNIEDFNCEWFCTNSDTQKKSTKKITSKKRDVYEIYGRNNVINTISCLDDATNKKTIDFLDRTTDNNSKKYISYRSRDELYNELLIKHNILPSRATFKGIASHLIETKYRGI